MPTPPKPFDSNSGARAIEAMAQFCEKHDLPDAAMMARVYSTGVIDIAGVDSEVTTALSARDQKIADTALAEVASQLRIAAALHGSTASEAEADGLRMAYQMIQARIYGDALPDPEPWLDINTGTRSADPDSLRPMDFAPRRWMP